jgi:hypothetical protein
LGSVESPFASWTTEVPELTLSGSQLAALPTAAIGAAFQVRQRGSYALSDSLTLTFLA